MEIKLKAMLRARDGRLYDLSGLTAELWDEDPMSDDLLAEAVVHGEGPIFRADFNFDPKKVASADSVGESSPDLYVVVKNPRRQTLFRSEVLKNISIANSSDTPPFLQLEFVEA